MSSQRQIEGTDLSSTDSRTGPIPRATMTAGSGGSDLTWPAVAACAMVLGFTVSLTIGSLPSNVVLAKQLHRLFAPRQRPAQPEARQALVITATRIDQLTVIATLSPRGFQPLLARTRREVLAQIRAWPGTLKLAVVDDTVPDYAFIAHVLKDHIPNGGIIVLKGSHRSQDVGAMLLTRLDRLAASRPGSILPVACLSDGCPQTNFQP
jgi:hypothetical protein